MPQADRRAARQSFWLFSIVGFQSAAGIVQLALTARILGPEGLGVLAVIIAVTSLLYGLLSVPGNQVITSYVTRSIIEGRMGEAAGTLRFVLLLSQVLSLVAYGTLAVIALTLSGLLGVAEDYRSALLLYGITGLVLGTVEESRAVLRLADRTHFGFATEVAGAIIRVVLLVLAWQNGGGLIMVVVSYVAGDMVVGAGTFIAAAASERRAGLPGFLRSLAVKVPGRDVVAFQAGLFAQASLVAVISRIDVIMLANLTNSAEVGLYRVGRQIVEVTQRPFAAISTGVQAEYSRQWYGGDGAVIRRISLRFSLFALGMSVVGYGLLVLIHGQVIEIMLGQRFEEAAQPLLILLPGALAFASVSAVYVLPAATGRITPQLASTLLTLVAMVAVLTVIAPRYGAVGAAWANSIGWLVFALAMIPFAVVTLRRTYRLQSCKAD